MSGRPCKTVADRQSRGDTSGATGLHRGRRSVMSRGTIDRREAHVADASVLNRGHSQRTPGHSMSPGEEGGRRQLQRARRLSGRPVDRAIRDRRASPSPSGRPAAPCGSVAGRWPTDTNTSAASISACRRVEAARAAERSERHSSAGCVTDRPRSRTGPRRRTTSEWSVRSRHVVARTTSASSAARRLRPCAAGLSRIRSEWRRREPTLAMMRRMRARRADRAGPVARVRRCVRRAGSRVRSASAADRVAAPTWRCTW